MIIDSHCHVYPKLSDYAQETLGNIPIPIKAELFNTPLTKLEGFIQTLKPQYRKLVKSYLQLVHRLQTTSRNLPENLIALSDTSIGILGAGNTLLDNNTDDLFEHMDQNNIDYSVLIAHPPYIPNDFILHLANRDSRIIPFVNIPYEKAGGDQLLEHYISLGARGLKIHAAADGGEIMSDHYLSLLEVAHKHKLPVIIHTGCIHIKPVYKDPEMGHADRFQQWFQSYPETIFILAHMNYHYPEVTIEMMQNFSNLYTDTSWQPRDVIVRAVHKLGAERIMFGSDWPIVGQNISIGLGRLQSAFQAGELSQQQLELIQGKNAAKLFGL